MAAYLRGGLSRRSFLLGASSFATTAAIAGRPGLLHARDLAAECGVCDPDERAWRYLAGQLDGQVLRPGDHNYLKAALPNNLRYACIMPRGIARCRSPEDVAAAISWCRDYDMPFTVRAGGHSYAGYSTTYGLMLDVSPMRQISFDKSTGLVTIGGGARNREVYAALQANKVAITHGRCPTVGAAAFLLGGGIGFNMRRKGLACDQMVRTELVTADGELRFANAGTNAGLFWASRGGGGGNFGVSTSFTLQTFSAETVTVFRLKWEKDTRNVAAALMPALETAPLTLGSRASFGAVTPQQYAKGTDVPINLLGQIVGSKQDLEDILATVPRPDASEILEKVDYWKGQHFLEEEGTPSYYQERSAFVVDPVGPAALDKGFEWLRSWPGTGAYCDLRFFQTGGAINQMAPTATAFPHRDSRWLMVVGLYWNERDDAQPDVMRRAHDWQNGFYQAMLPFAGRGAYVNFPDPSLANWRRAYYGRNADRLSEIKAAVDPTNVFQFPQAL